MITIQTFVFNPFQENTFILYDETGECVIVDAGCYEDNERKILSKFISSRQLKPVKLLNTHNHLDHLFGNEFIVETYKIKPEAHKSDDYLIDNAVEHAAIFGLTFKKPPVVSNYLTDGETIIFGNSKLTVLHVPGHTLGHVAFLNLSQKFVLTGDVLFNGSIGRTDLEGGDFETLVFSIKKKLLTLPNDVIVYPGHGPTTTIGKEKETNNFLQ
jgi:glyoxylase-like metal-dependent hydrolase (beta-lactamase superfamily II)